MSSKVQDCAIILRRWDHQAGLVETSLPFGSLDELYAHCLASPDPGLIDRIIIRGLNGAGQPQVVTFVFQSITVTPETK